MLVCMIKIENCFVSFAAEHQTIKFYNLTNNIIQKITILYKLLYYFIKNILNFIKIILVFFLKNSLLNMYAK